MLIGSQHKEKSILQQEREQLFPIGGAPEEDGRGGCRGFNEKVKASLWRKIAGPFL